MIIAVDNFVPDTNQIKIFFIVFILLAKYHIMTISENLQTSKLSIQEMHVIYAFQKLRHICLLIVN